MHTIFRDSLPDAIGESKFVIVLNFDVRGFSSFSKTVDSAQSALYIKKIFIRLINEYFHDASYYKSTGDGLIVIYNIEEKRLSDLSELIVKNAILISNNFASLCDNEAMINFDVPQKCGIGISRGPATCLRTGDKILDYSGDTLNVASRLMDCARPAGVIFDKKFGFDLLSDKVKEQFSYNEIFLKGVSEDKPIGIYYLSDKTIISPELTKPINRLVWEEVQKKWKFSELQLLGGTFNIPLNYKPINETDIAITVVHPLVRKGKLIKNYETTFTFSGFKYIANAGKQKISIDLGLLTNRLLKLNGLKPNTEISLTISYPRN